MAYVAPNTTIYLYKNVPLSPSYTDSVVYSGSSAFVSALSSYSHLSFTNQYYQRTTRGTLRVQTTMANMLGVNYLAWENTSHENKWYFAFVTNFEYVNENCVEVYYFVDVLQTYMHVWTLKQCFIERQHTATDVLATPTNGGNVTEEDLGLGYSYVCSSGTLGNLETHNLQVMILVAENSVGTHLAGTAVTDAYFSGISTQSLGLINSTANITSTLSALAAWVDSGKTEAIKAMYLAPANFISTAGTAMAESVYGGGSNAFGGYTPKNNKLYTYPYYFFHVTDHKSGNTDLYPQLFTTRNAMQFNVTASTMYPPFIQATPRNYRGLSYDYENTVIASNFGLCAWENDNFSEWLNDNAGTIALGALSGVTGSAQYGYTSGRALGAMVGSTTGYGAMLGMAAGGAAGLAAGVAQGVGQQTAGLLAKYIDLKSTPNAAYGNSVSNISTVIGSNYLQCYCMSLCAEQAEIVDNYFSMYGYAIHKVGTPKVNVRPYWTYVKTVGNNVTGTIPAEYKAQINNIFDSGCRFWNSLSNIGDYSLDNSPS